MIEAFLSNENADLVIGSSLMFALSSISEYLKSGL